MYLWGVGYNTGQSVSQQPAFAWVPAKGWPAMALGFLLTSLRAYIKSFLLHLR